MKIGIAQVKPDKGDITANIEKHLQVIRLAASLNAGSIFFPELSLTGYEPELAKDLAINVDDSRLDVIQKISDANKITIGSGGPVKTKTGIRISMILFQPCKPTLIYSKQQLHDDELPYFEEGTEQVIVTINNKKIAPAICYESLQINHADHVSKLGAEIYLASVAKPQNGINKAMIHYPAIAKKFSMPVLMANCVGYCDNFMSMGNSAVWNKQGVLLAQLDEQQEGILVFNTETEEIVKRYL